MDKILDKLEKTIKTKNLGGFIVFPNDEKFKPIKGKRLEEVIQKLKKNPDEYVDELISTVGLNVSKQGHKSKIDLFDKAVFAIVIKTYKINKDCELSKKSHEQVHFMLNYTLDELKEHPFKLKNLEKLVYLAANKEIRSDIFGITYTRFLEQLESLKKNTNKNLI